MSDEKIIAYKGFNKDMTCLGFQYEEGKTYECDEAILCEKGFHACLRPLDVLNYYPPASSVYHIVELEGVCSKLNEDSKVCARKITIGRQILISELAELTVEYAKTHHKGGNESQEGQFKFVDEYGIVTANREGNNGVATAGDFGVATAGDCGVAIARLEGVATAGYLGLATAEDCGVAQSGDRGTSSSRGSSSSGCNGLSVARGKDARVKGGDDAVLVIAIEDNFENIVHFNTAIVGQYGIKPDTWYTLDENGEFVECSIDKN